MKARVGTAAAVGVALLVTGCSTGSKPAASTATQGHRLHVAALLAGTDSSWDLAVKDGLQSEAKDKDVDLTVFDAGYDPNKQFSQLQTVIASGKYNAVSVLPIAPEQMCPALQKLGESGTPVIVMDQLTCVPPTAALDALRGEHLTAFVGGDSTMSLATPWTDYIVKNNPGPQKILLLTGPKGSAITTVLTTALSQSIQAAGSSMKVITADTDFTRSTGQQKTEALLQSNKDITIVAGPTDATAGAIAALHQAGLKNVKTYVYGGDKNAIAGLKDGTIAMVQVARPRAIGVATADEWADYQSTGKAIPIVFTPDVEPGKPPAAVLTPANVGSFTAEY